ncbi:MAG TPA: protein-L-isoaspartate O-methyltransferase [Bacteroidales bacterium]|nr:MAG: protein-L-isoaspartate O-methyltransferase [Bacteroidetes bacterium GWE2_42_24]OFY28907.1 MAG: protein-L-isoaspartate O-methyltransferase [Bacteroidetes bacterium GWF2_43_11]HBZ67728.1 protein-L-isoaspartate O-methyltransferase [Bacteroidales bacterium]
MQDTFRHKGLRKKLIEQLRLKGITNEAVLQALEKIPRHLFLDLAFLEFAYQDKPFPIGSGQTISQPYTVAFQTQLLDPKPREKVLEIGTGSGYQACVLAEMGVKVFSVERQKKLFEKAKTFLPELGFQIRLFYGDGYKGLPPFAPFDKILITAGAPYLPEALIQQLKPGGRLVVPIGNSNHQEMTLITKLPDGTSEIKEFGGFLFVPMLENKAQD